MPDFLPEERRLLSDTLDDFLTSHCGFDKQHAAQAAVEFRADIWRTMAELGWLGVGVSEQAGGAGGGPADVGILMHGLGSTLMREPYLSSILLSARLIEGLGAAEGHVGLAQALAGEKVLAFAFTEPDLGFARAPLATLAERVNEGYHLSGEKSFVLGGATAHAWLVSARDYDGRTGVYWVESKEPGVTVQPYETIDRRGAAQLVFRNAAAARLDAEGGDAARVIDSVLDYATVAVAYEAIGCMSRVIELTKEHLNTRQQFGRPLAAFQVLRHRLTDMYVAMEETKAMVDVAGSVLDSADQERGITVSALKVHLGRATRLVAQQGVQLHGAMGMTDEFPISHYFKRLLMIEMLFGNADFHLRRYEQLRGAGFA